MNLNEVIKRLRYKSENIKAKLEPTFFAECADYLEKYRWHDLRKNPEDLPDEGKKVYVCYKRHPNAHGEQKIAYGTDVYRHMCDNKDGTKFCIFGKGNRVIAWREIEKFEEET